MVLPVNSRSASQRYLVVYNTLSALLRAFILVRTIYLWTTNGTTAVWLDLNVLTLWTETIAAIEVIHAATGLVRASPATTALQVAGRNTIVWAITRNYPDVAASGWAYTSMLTVWNAADTLRYLYFAVEKATAQAPHILLWLRSVLPQGAMKVRRADNRSDRYNMFIVLYPIGILSEMWLVYQVIVPSKARNMLYQYLLYFGLAIYVPGQYEASWLSSSNTVVLTLFQLSIFSTVTCSLNARNRGGRSPRLCRRGDERTILRDY
jgi:very-long-chain (3R)-3-hydroxyacyl-CoA dehydratase